MTTNQAAPKTLSGYKLGYVRVSKADQNSELQIDALVRSGVDPKNIFIDHGVSGSKAQRPELDRMLGALREGDEIVVYKLDRLARNTKHLLELVERLDAKGVGFRSITEGISTTGAMGKAMLTIMSAFGELERSQLIERTTAGLSAARDRGRLGGRPATITPDKAQMIMSMVAGKASVTAIAKTLGVSRNTIYRHINAATAGS